MDWLRSLMALVPRSLNEAGYPPPPGRRKPSGQKRRDRRHGRHLDRLLAPAEDARAGTADEIDPIAVDPQAGALAEPHDGYRVLLVELADPRLARLAHVGLAWSRVDVVGVDLEPHQAERLERRRLHDRHVVGGHDRRAREVRSGARARVGHAVPGAVADGVEHLQPHELVEQTEGVASATEDRLGVEHRLPWVGGLVERVESEP